MSRLYEFELYDLAGNRIADISHLATNRRYSMQRNEAEQLTFSLDLNLFEGYCDSIGSYPENVLTPYQTDVRVKREGQYLFGVHVVDAVLDAGVESQTISVAATGFLDLFKDRYTTETFTGVESTGIASGIIDHEQGKPNGDMGVTIGPDQFITGVQRDRTYERSNAKRSLQNLTSLATGNFDFAFTADKLFNTYEQLGAARDDLYLVYGGAASNIKHLYYPKTGLRTFNFIYGLGSGFGADQLLSEQGDEASQLAYYRREAIRQFNSVIDQAVLDQNTLGEVELSRELLKIPQVTFTGRELAGKPFIAVGDRVPIRAEGHSYLRDLPKRWRVEKLDVTIDDNDFESEIRLYFDDYKVVQDEEA